ncbi:MAG: hypothetical protein WCH78_06915 [Bacteroidota bacterium]
MRAQLVCLFILCGLSFSAFSQRDFRVYTEADNFKKNTIRLMLEKNKPGTYTCTITFKQLMGYRCSEGDNNFSVTVNGSNLQQIASLTPIENAGSYSISYSYSFQKGRSITKLDSLYPYLLPSSPGKSIKTSGTYYIGELFGKSSSDFYAMGFQYHLGDTICATRAGLVYEASDNAEHGKENEIYNSNSRNNIFIEHIDGTLARYNVQGSIKLIVQVGDKVIPGQPIAVFDKQDKIYSVIFDVFYLNMKLKSEAGTNYFTARPRFLLSENNIDLASAFTNYPDVIHPNEIVIKELTNREIKKLGLKH